MNTQHIARLEAQLEKLVEGTFTHLFGKKIRAHDIALELSRAMEDSADTLTLQGDPRPLAPDRYSIYVNDEVRTYLLQRQPALLQILSQHLVELAANAGYRLNNMPVLDLLIDDDLKTGQITVKASHINKKNSTTAIMQRVDLATSLTAPQNPQLLIHGKPPIALEQDVVNIGRSRDNHIVIDDPTVSRHHLQLRRRFDRYLLFDAHSQGGTYVNDVRISEHSLQTGDVIRIGSTQMVYMEDQPLSDTQTGNYPEVGDESPGME